MGIPGGFCPCSIWVNLGHFGYDPFWKWLVCWFSALKVSVTFFSLYACIPDSLIRFLWAILLSSGFDDLCPFWTGFFSAGFSP